MPVNELKLGLVGVAITLAACGGATEDVAPDIVPTVSAEPRVMNPPYMQQFHMDAFERNIRAHLDESTIGYSYAVFQGTSLVKQGANGYANVDIATLTSMTPDRRMDVASMSKTVTAAAVMKALEVKNLSVDTPIFPYLPSNWKPTAGPGVSQITFHDLLSHTSGLNEYGNWYANLQQMIDDGVTNMSRWHKVVYNNSGYALLRVLLPYLVYGSATYAPYESGLNYFYTALDYRSYVQQKVFAPFGGSSIDVVYVGPAPATTYYVFDDPSIYRQDPTDYTNLLTAGPGCWTMSALEYGAFIANLRFGNIVSPATYAKMRDTLSVDLSNPGARLGMWAASEAHGTYYNHNGEGAYGNNQPIGPNADWVVFPNNVSAVFLANSNLTKESPYAVLRDAYNGAWW